MPQKSPRYYTKLKKQLEAQYTGPFFYALRRQKKPLLDAFRSTDNQALAILRFNMAAMQNPISPEPLFKVYQRLYKRVSLDHANELYRDMVNTKRLGAVSAQWLADIIEFLEGYMFDNIVVPMTQRTMERMLKVIAEGINEGDSYDVMLRKLEDTELDKVRARLIARTEVGRAVSYGHDLGARELPFLTTKKWSSAKDNRTRGTNPEDKADHRDLDNVTVEMDEPFTDPRNGDKLMFPGDTTLGAGPASCCNCRCSVMYVPKRDKRGQLIMKPSP